MSLEEPRFVDSKEILLAGLEERYTFDRIGEIPLLWQRIDPHFDRIPGQVGSVSYGVSLDMSDTGFRYMAAVEVDDAADLPEGFTTMLLPAQQYAVFPYRQHISKMCETIDAIWKQWLPTSGRQVVDPPLMIERYGETFDPGVGHGDVELWLPIKS